MSESLLRPADTTPEAARVYWDMIRQMPRERRLKRIVELSRLMRAFVTANIRRRHPTYTDEQVRNAVWERVYGREVLQRCARQESETP